MSTATKTFEYAVRDRRGKLVSGKLEAPSEAAVVQRLRGMGYAPVSLRESGTGMNREISLPFGGGVKLKDLAVMSRQFATMINSGLSLLRALSILADQTESKPLAKALAEVRTAVETGQSLSAGTRQAPEDLPPARHQHGARRGGRRVPRPGACCRSPRTSRRRSSSAARSNRR